MFGKKLFEDGGFIPGMPLDSLLKLYFQNEETRSSLVVQWLELCTFTAEGMGSIPGQGQDPASCVAKKKTQNNNNSITLQERGEREKGPHNKIVGVESKWASIIRWQNQVHSKKRWKFNLIYTTESPKRLRN